QLARTDVFAGHGGLQVERIGDGVAGDIGTHLRGIIAGDRRPVDLDVGMQRLKVMQVLLDKRILGGSRRPAGDGEGYRAALWRGSCGVGAARAIDIAIPASNSLLVNAIIPVASIAATAATTGSQYQSKD